MSFFCEGILRVESEKTLKSAKSEKTPEHCFLHQAHVDHGTAWNADLDVLSSGLQGQ